MNDVKLWKIPNKVPAVVLSDDPRYVQPEGKEEAWLVRRGEHNFGTLHQDDKIWVLPIDGRNHECTILAFRR